MVVALAQTGVKADGAYIVRELHQPEDAVSQTDTRLLKPLGALVI